MSGNRNKIYLAFLTHCETGKATIDDLIKLGYQLIKKHKLHHHFFLDRSLKTTAQALTYHALRIHSHHKNEKVSSSQALTTFALFEKRIEDRLPVEYITNEANYLDRSFYVNENVLIPRSIMNTRFSDFLKEVSWKDHTILDLCTGSGCIGITLALIDPIARIDLADISEKALEVAKINIERYQLQNRVQCIQSDLFSRIHKTYDLIITNPPYVTTKDYARIPEEFKKEPKIALEAGQDGLAIINHIIEQAKIYLNPKGILIAEVGSSAVKALKKKYPHIPFKWLKYRPPHGRESFFAEPGILQCYRDHLP